MNLKWLVLGALFALQLSCGSGVGEVSLASPPPGAVPPTPEIEEGTSLVPRCGAVRLVSSGEGGAAEQKSVLSGISFDGGRVLYHSHAANLVEGDTNEDWDVFLYQSGEQRPELISKGVDGPSNGASDVGAISSDGKAIVFGSEASNLVSGDENRKKDVFLWREGEEITLMSVNDEGEQGNGKSYFPDISSDGEVVAFVSDANNFSVVPDNNGSTDVFVRVPQEGVTRRVSVRSSGHEASKGARGLYPLLSGDGDIILFSSYSNDLLSTTSINPMYRTQSLCLR